MNAVRSGHVDLIRLLLENQADLEAKTKQGKTVLKLVEGMGNADVAKVFEELKNQRKMRADAWEATTSQRNVELVEDHRTLF